MYDTVCVLMAKQPQVGCTKTRLSLSMSSQQAVELYEALLRDSIALVEEQPRIDLAVAFSPAGSQAYFSRITPSDAYLLPVEGSDIGDCLSQVFSHLLEMGWRKVLALNADSPSLPGAYLEQAAQLLDEQELVLGPALDGGYYLVGMRRSHLGIFQDITWSTERVLAQTLEKAGGLGLGVRLTPEWYDVDTVADLQRLQAELNCLPAQRLVHTRKFLDGFGQAHL